MHGTIIYVILSKLTNFYIRKNILRAYDIYNTDMDLNKNKLIEKLGEQTDFNSDSVI